MGSWAWIGFRGAKRSTGWGLKVRAIQGLYKRSLEAMLWQGRLLLLEFSLCQAVDPVPRPSRSP